VRVDYRQFYLMPFNVDATLDPAWRGRLLAPSEDGHSVIVLTGCASGPVLVTVRSLDTPPAPLVESMDGWQVGVEDTVDVDGKLNVVCWEPTEDTYEAFTPNKPGPHRVRVLARGRAEHYDHVVEEATEEYDISIWPTDGAAPRLSLGDDGVT